jgi:hypothetical protein
MKERDRKIRFGIDWEGQWNLHVVNNWYDGPYWDVQVGPFWCVFSRYGLPYILQGEK